jgi:hypothetical protein
LTLPNVTPLALAWVPEAIPCVLPGKLSKLDFFGHLIGDFISGLQES